jgi:hypothetical protein
MDERPSCRNSFLTGFLLLADVSLRYITEIDYEFKVTTSFTSLSAVLFSRE